MERERWKEQKDWCGQIEKQKFEIYGEENEKVG